MLECLIIGDSIAVGTHMARPEAHMSSDRIHPTGKGYKILGEQTK